MKDAHIQLMRTLVACQVAVVEHADEDVSEDTAKSALIECLTRALKLAKKLDT